MGRKIYLACRFLGQVSTKVYSVYTTIKLRLFGAEIGKRVIFKRPIEFYNPHNLKIGDDTIIHQFVSLKAPDGKKGITIGKRCKINIFSVVNGGDIRIGDDCLFGPGVYIFSGDHGSKKGELIRKQIGVTNPITINNDVWLGSGVTVLKGVSIGKGSIIGASSVVNKDIQANSIAVGIPAKEIRKRI